MEPFTTTTNNNNNLRVPVGDTSSMPKFLDHHSNKINHDVIQESPSNNTETYFGVFCEEGQLPEAVKHLPIAK